MRGAGSRVANAPGDPRLKNPITGIVGCCARAASGHAAAPPRAKMNSRRLMSNMRPAFRQRPTDPCKSVYRALSLPQEGRHCSESEALAGPQSASSKIRIAAHGCVHTPFYVFMPGQRGAFSALR